MIMSTPVREKLTITGIVQGVGFRPFIHSLARRFGLTGYVLNTPDGVIVEAEGNETAIGRFAAAIRTEAPPLSTIVSINREQLSAETDGNRLHPNFSIRTSTHAGRSRTLIPPDTSICPDCLSEMFDPADRRYRYPFINCTNCGPRYTIITDLPYDRPFTTMAGFDMCNDCRTEYENPHNRRYHAQPVACPVCGPVVALLDGCGEALDAEPIPEAIRLLKAGNILAVKGLGGFHLAVDATNTDAVARLRQRKHRDEKPFAVMVPSPRTAYRLGTFTDREKTVLTGHERPIVLVPKSGRIPLAPNVAPRNPYLGIMLPYTPLHYLLFHDPHSGGEITTDTPLFTALVMTSGNLSEEPICRTTEEAVERLQGIADAFLVHNRDIHIRCDDSVVTTVAGNISFMRRARGYVPVPVFLERKLPQTIAFGGELKNTICLVDGKRAFVSQHIGDMENEITFESFREAIDHLSDLLEITPSIYACDLHPDYLPTRHCRDLLEGKEPDSYGAAGIQHHHAHIASVMAEHHVDGPVIGISTDGTGYGMDGTVWGGEFLVAGVDGFARVGHIRPVRLPGGEKAIREPWRTSVSWMREAFGDEWRSVDSAVLHRATPEELDMVERILDTGLNSPHTSSLGRLFDAVSSMLGICHESRFEGQAAFMLDMAAHETVEPAALAAELRILDGPAARHFPLLSGTLEGTEPMFDSSCDLRFELDFRGLVRSCVEQLAGGTAPVDLAAGFHEALMNLFVDAVLRIHVATGIATVALSGGSWQNRYMGARFPDRLKDRGFTVLTNRLVPPNDGGVSLGQAYIAATIAANRE